MQPGKYQVGEESKIGPFAAGWKLVPGILTHTKTEKIQYIVFIHCWWRQPSLWKMLLSLKGSHSSKTCMQLLCHNHIIKKDEKNGGDDKQMDFKSFTQLAGRLSTHLPTCENLETCAESAIRQWAWMRGGSASVRAVVQRDAVTSGPLLLCPPTTLRKMKM